MVLTMVLLLILALIAGCASSTAAGNAPKRSADRPNIVLIVADDLGYADLGFTGAADIPTPHLDRLAAEGVFCTDGHVSASVCAPSRAGLLTGRYQQRQGFEMNLRPNEGLLPGTITLPAQLQRAGYRTAAIGKWHVGYQVQNTPVAAGFDHFCGLLSGSRSYFPMEKAPGKTKRIERNGEVVPESNLGYLTDFFTYEGVSVLEEESTEPLFLYMSYTAPHGPMHARPDLYEALEAIEEPGRRKYAAMVAALDEGVGELRAALERTGQADNTLIIFLSDNGGATNNHSDNGPWRGMKGSKWEGGQRVPFLVHWPARLAPQRFDHVVSSLDLTPTFLAAAGASSVDPSDGENILPWLEGRVAAPEARTLYFRRGVVAAIREGDWKLIRVTEEDGSLRSPVLVDLARDPGELVDVSGEEPERVQALMGKLDEWESELQPPRWFTGEVWTKNQRLKHQPDLIGRDAERRLP